MINSSLFAFTAALIRAGHIRSDDVRRLQRHIIPDGINSRAEGELLLRLDQSVSRADPTFSAWLATVMVDFVVWGARPTGYVDRETTEWLVSVLGGSRGPTRRALLITSEIVREAHNIDEALLSWMRTNSREAPRGRLERMSVGRLQHTPSSSRASSLWRQLPGQGAAAPSRIARPRPPTSLPRPEPKREAGAVPPPARFVEMVQVQDPNM